MLWLRDFVLARCFCRQQLYYVKKGVIIITVIETMSQKVKKKRVSIDISSYQETQGEMFKDF